MFEPRVSQVITTCRVRRASAVLAWLLAAPAIALACRFTVRDVGFVDLGGEAFRLCWVEVGGTPTSSDVFRAVAAGLLHGTNIEYEAVIEREHPAAIALKEADAGAGLVLLSPEGRSYVVAAAGEVSADRDELWKLIESVASCPLRDKVLETAVETFCTILFVEGADSEMNKLVKAEIDRAVRRLHDVADQLPRPIDDGPVVEILSSADKSRERILLWSLGVEPREFDQPHVAVLYGRARRMGPLLSGLDVTADELLRRLTLVGQSCECELDRAWIRGTALPVRWPAARDRDVFVKLGFDPASPMVRAEISRILSRGPNSQAAAPSEKSIEEMLFGYSEELISGDAPDDVAEVVVPEAEPLIAAESEPAAPGSPTRGVTYALASLAGLSALGGAIVLLRARRNAV